MFEIINKIVMYGNVCIVISFSCFIWKIADVSSKKKMSIWWTVILKEFYSFANAKNRYYKFYIFQDEKQKLQIEIHFFKLLQYFLA